MVHNIYKKFRLGQGLPIGTVMHEFGHNCGLDHPFDGDNCDDTQTRTIVPKDKWCNSSVAGCGNNVMDYTSYSDAMSRCQVLTMHRYLLGFEFGSIQNCLRDPITTLNPNISGPSCISGNLPTTYSLSNYEFGNDVTWSVSPASSVVASTGCGNNFLFTPISGASGIVTLNVTVGWGAYGTRTNSKSITLSPAGQILGTFTYNGITQGLNTTPTPCVVPAASVSVGLTSPANATFTWTRISGPGIMYTSNFGRSGTMNMTTGTTTVYNVSTSSSCGVISRSFTFYRPSSSFITISPNPANNQTSIVASERILVDFYDDKNQKSSFELDPSINRITVVDEIGNKVLSEKHNKKLKNLNLNTSNWKIGNYIIQIFDNETLYLKNLQIIR